MENKVEAYKKCLVKIFNLLKNSSVNWAVFGSANLMLQGLPADPNDIDILTDKKGAYKIEEILKGYITRKVKFSSNGKIQSHYGDLEIDGIKVQIIGDFRSSIDFEPIADLNNGIEMTGLGDIKLPCLPLKNELYAYRRLERPEKIKLIESWTRNER